jgi:hypothetical protein
MGMRGPRPMKQLRAAAQAPAPDAMERMIAEPWIQGWLMAMQHPDEALAATACRQIALAAEARGIPTERWVRFFDECGWDVKDAEQEASDE